MTRTRAHPSESCPYSFYEEQKTQTRKRYAGDAGGLRADAGARQSVTQGDGGRDSPRASGQAVRRHRTREPLFREGCSRA